MANKPIIELPTAEGYNKWAPIYDTNGNPLIMLDEDAFMRDFPVDELPGKTILDLGCGTGRLTNRLAEQGAIAIGIDGSEGMLKIARKKGSAANYILHDLSKSLPFENNHFDFVVSTLVLEHIENLLFFFEEINRVSKPEALIYISAMHPGMMLKSTQANFTDPETGVEIRPKGYPHQLSDFILNMSKAGLVLQNMHEQNGTEELVTKVAKAQKYLNWPMLVTFTLKPSVA